MFKTGEILRYDDGPTALMEVTYVSKRHDGHNDRYYGVQCMGGYVGRYEDQVQRASKADLKTWKANKRWRSDSRPPTGRGIVGALEDGA